MEKVVFGGGCFWCTEAVFKMMKGVSQVLSGYAHVEKTGVKPSYELVSSGTTNFAESAYIEYDSSQVKYRDLLTVFFGSHDPTTVNRQGNDIGPQYRSVIFYTTEEQKKETEEFIKEINTSNSAGALVVTEVEPLGEFFEAEDYHKNYYENNKNAKYCELVINPKLEKVKKDFANLLTSE